MKIKQLVPLSLTGALVAIGLITCNPLAHANVTFDGSSTAGWTTDRYSPSSFTSGTAPDSTTAFATTISSADSSANRPSGYSSSFYNTQGVKTYVSGSIGNWAVSESLYVTADMLTGTGSPLSSEIWAGTSADSSSQGGFYVMGLVSGMSARDASASPTSSSQIGVFDDITGNWSYFSTAGLSVGWNQFSITYDGSSVNYSVNGNLITSQGSSITSQDPYVNSLTTLYLEDYNAYGLGDFPDQGGYTIYRKDVTATFSPVPEPSTYAAAGLMLLPLGAALLKTIRRKQFAVEKSNS
jgi:hypothetical protein